MLLTCRDLRDAPGEALNRYQKEFIDGHEMQLLKMSFNRFVQELLTLFAVNMLGFVYEQVITFKTSDLSASSLWSTETIFQTLRSEQ